MNKYSNIYFTNQWDRNRVWQKFMNKEDIYNAIESVSVSIGYMSKHPPHRLNKEDMSFMEKPLAELEIAIKKIKKIPSLFNLNDEEIKEITETYNN